jgi:DUF4097 and DUF4098 domain-containing protein YvlB
LKSIKERKGYSEENLSAFEKVEEPCSRFLEEEENEVGKSGDQESAKEGKKEARRVAFRPLR